MLRILKLPSGIQEAIFRGESKGGVTGIKVLMGLWATCSPATALQPADAGPAPEHPRVTALWPPAQGSRAQPLPFSGEILGSAGGHHSLRVPETPVRVPKI